MTLPSAWSSSVKKQRRAVCSRLNSPARQRKRRDTSSEQGPAKEAIVARPVRRESTLKVERGCAGLGPLESQGVAKKVKGKGGKAPQAVQEEVN